ncbi:MAG: hydantoinase/oxoprolinase family protein [Dehalococcoidia bacterium]|nr:hydantoinase/oxoprolinase family protein [Dehalococcoidia bacterium]
MAGIIAIDCGGTFTDLVYVSSEGRIYTTKAHSTPSDFSEGTLNAIGNMAAMLKISPESLLDKLSLFAFSSTVSTNMLLTRTGARTGLITTRGFEDTLFIGRIFQKIAGLKEQEVINMTLLDKAEPIIPRVLVKGVTERIDYKGEVIVPLNIEETRVAVTELVQAGVESIAVSTLWSFINPENELKIRQLIRSMYPDIFISLSSDLAPVIGEYERTATTAVNAFLGPVNSRGFTALSKKLQSSGLRGEPMMMQGAGGYATVAQACEKPVLTLSSGPAGGIVAARTIGGLSGYDDIITADVGGTSFDVGLIINGQVEFATRPVFGKYSLCLPLLDITSIGAGGGSIAWLEPVTKRLKVGPQSAGADPGPVCYEKGGTEPTVTDADLVLGRYNRDNFLGGEVKINYDLALKAIQQKIAAPLKMSPIEAAMGIVDIVDSNMASLVRKITVGGGHDPQKFVLFSFGGAGPSHVCSFAPAVGVKHVVIPPQASVFSALGIATSDVINIREISDPLAYPFSVQKLNDIFERLENEVLGELKEVGIARDNIVLTRSVDMKYKGQVHEVRTVVPPGKISDQTAESMAVNFEEAYEQKYGKGTTYKGAGIQALTWRVVGQGHTLKPTFKKLPMGSKDASRALVGTREVYFSETRGETRTDIYERDRLLPGNTLSGPAIVESRDTTIVVHPAQRAHIDEYLNVILRWD